MRICDWSNKEFKTSVLRKLCDLQGNNARETRCEQNEKFNRETEIRTRKKIGILELKDTMNKLKNPTETTNSRMDQAQESVN